MSKSVANRDASSIGFAPTATDLPLPTDTLPDIVKAVIVDKKASREAIMRAAVEAESSGFPKLATALRSRIGESQSPDNTLIKSPWKDTTDAAWTRFCRVMAEGNSPSKVSPKGFFGLFQLSVKRLCDLGVMRNPRSHNIRLSSGAIARVWEGTWNIPQESFLSDPALQYKIFARSMELHRSIIAEKYKQVVGLPIEGVPATLSGLLALAHTAGAGMYKWLTEKDIRRKFTWVTDAYLRANGIF